MSVKDIIDLVAPHAPGWGRPALRKLVQEAQDELFDCEGPLAQWIGTDNEGFPPYLITASGTYEYAITGANLSSGSITRSIGGTTYAVRAKRVLKVFVDVTQQGYDYDKRWLGRPYVYYAQNPYSNAKTRLAVSDVPVESHPALEGTTASVRFRENPGTETQKYFCLFTWEPPRITSESIPLVVPKKYEVGIRKYVMGTVQELANGKASDQLAEFFGKWKPEFQCGEAVLGAQSFQSETSPRVC